MTNGRYDVAVVGAGPAGAACAAACAARGLQTILIEREVFPRYKVCGGCLSAGGMELLHMSGLGTVFAESRYMPLDRLDVVSAGRCVRIALERGCVIDRAGFDEALARGAVEKGVEFRDGTRAELAGQTRDGWAIGLRKRGPARTEGQIMARMVVAADGLAGGFARVVLGERTVGVGSRIGAGTTLPGDAVPVLEQGATRMFTSQWGYLGLARRADGGINTAAALDPSLVKREGSVGAACAWLARRAGEPLAMQGEWKATPALTVRPSRRAGWRLFAIGDAAGYVEPFTGEGMTWGIREGIAAVDLIERVVRIGWSESMSGEWELAYRRAVGRRQRACRLVAAALRRPWATRALLGTIERYPEAAGPLIRVAAGDGMGATR